MRTLDFSAVKINFMFRQATLIPLILGTSMVLVQDIVQAQSAQDVAKIARAVSVKIQVDGTMGQMQGSGVILQKQGDLYTVLTTAHVVRSGKSFQLTTAIDNQSHPAIASSVKTAGGDLDLAVVQFRSRQNYAVAKVGNSNLLEVGMDAYAAGFLAPTSTISESTWVFTSGKVTANGQRAIQGGYSLTYNTNTLPGMSGGAVFNQSGELIAIHGRGDRSADGQRTGINSGIPINRFGEVAKQLGVAVEIAAVPTRTGNSNSAQDVAKIARAVSVKIQVDGTMGQGSGVILQKQGDLYTVLTTAHVVRRGRSFQLTTAIDNQSHPAISGSVKIAGSDLDLAVIQFRSRQNYAVAKVGDSTLLEVGMNAYLAGFPAAISESLWVFNSGTVTANGRRAMKDGYSLIYNTNTLPGMAGGGVFNQAGELVAIHGKGDRSADGQKTGFNLGIPINRFSEAAKQLGVTVEIAAVPTNAPPKADDFYLSGNSKYLAGNYQGAMTDYNLAIALNSKYAAAYVRRGVLKDRQLNDLAGAMADYNQAIAIDPNNAEAYYWRSLLKKDKLNDSQGATADLEQAISLNPVYKEVYNDRGADVAKIAKAISVKIENAEGRNQGSGVILRRQGDLYSVLTAAHVLKSGRSFKITTAVDNRTYEVMANSVHRSKNGLDLAIVQFRSSQSYQVAKIGNSNLLEEGMDIFVTGFPLPNQSFTKSIWVFREGKVSANSNQRLDAGYSLVYSNETVPGMSGGAVLNRAGELVAIHGKADLSGDKSTANRQKTGYNFGIPINWIGEMMRESNLELGLTVAAVPTTTTPKANDYLVAGSRNYESGNYRLALSEYNRAITLNPSYATAYYGRGMLKAYQLDDRAGAIKDFRAAARIYRQKGRTRNLKDAIEQLQKLNATE
jgi:tetratricopeptide (TPR) repeat protein